MYRTIEDVIRDNRNMSNFAWGREEGLEEGLEKGAIAEKREIARNCKDIGMSVADISKITGLSHEDIAAL